MLCVEPHTKRGLPCCIHLSDLSVIVIIDVILTECMSNFSP